MNRDHDPFGRALSALRDRLKTTDFVDSAPLSIADLARELRLSPTPIREALARLAGEGLIEDHRGRGYFTRRLDALDLAELYALEALYLGAACAMADELPRAPDAPSVSLAAPEPDQPLVEQGEALLARVVAASGNRTLMALNAILQGRLHPARRLEAAVLPDLAGELDGLRALIDRQAWKALAAALGAYHDRRRQAVTEIVQAARRQTR